MRFLRGANQSAWVTATEKPKKDGMTPGENSQSGGQPLKAIDLLRLKGGN